MADAVPYLAFDGNAAEVMAFYHSAFGGELITMTFKESLIKPSPAQVLQTNHALCDLWSSTTSVSSPATTPRAPPPRRSAIPSAWSMTTRPSSTAGSRRSARAGKSSFPSASSSGATRSGWLRQVRRPLDVQRQHRQQHGRRMSEQFDVSTPENQKRHEFGLGVLELVDGEAGDRLLEALGDVAPDMVHHISAFAYGDIYARPGLENRAIVNS